MVGKEIILRVCAPRTGVCLQLPAEVVTCAHFKDEGSKL